MGTTLTSSARIVVAAAARLALVQLAPRVVLADKLASPCKARAVGPVFGLRAETSPSRVAAHQTKHCEGPQQQCRRAQAKDWQAKDWQRVAAAQQLPVRLAASSLAGNM
jgi:hypothetical protein